MPKGKKKEKVKGKSVDRDERGHDMPSVACQEFIVEVIVRFYETNSSMALESKYVRYAEESISKFQEDMKQIFMDALHVPMWFHETEKPGYLSWLDKRVHDALWNAKPVLTKYGKEHRAGDTSFEQVLLRAELLAGQLRPFAKKYNRLRSVGWWASAIGKHEENANRRHLIALPNTARVTQVDNNVKMGGYATIRKVRIDGMPGIQPHWEFAAKISNQHRTRPDLAKLEHQNEMMTMRIQHAGVI